MSTRLILNFIAHKCELLYLLRYTDLVYKQKNDHIGNHKENIYKHAGAEVLWIIFWDDNAVS